MNDAGQGRHPTTRWWLSPALARLAFGDATRDASTRTSRPTFPPALVRDIDLDDPAQREFGDYELIEEVGRGGMGVVYRARQRGLDREVALKLLSASHWASEEFVENFRREAQNAALLQHPNIVVVHEMGDHAGLIFYAMQLVRGLSLSQRLDHDGPLQPREAARLLRTIAEAVDYAHRLGVLHLDLKPGNILINESGEPLVADFGLARRLEQALDNERIAGTPSYMAPEQAQMNGALSPATDVWALGAVLYEMLTGRPPFEAEDPLAALRLLREGAVRKPSRYLSLPADLEAICLKCLQRDPQQRYASARALADDLGRFLEGRAVSVRPLNAVQRMARWALREKLLAGAVGAALMVLVVGMITTSLQKQRADTNAATASERLWESRREAALRLEQDGKGWEALPRLLQNIDEQQRAGKTDLAQLELRRIGMMLGQGATLIDTIAIADANPLAVALSDDGSLLAIALNDQSVRWFDTSTLRERGRVSLAALRNNEGQPRVPMLLRFVDSRRLRATFEWYSNFVSPNEGDSWLIDLDRKAVILPPPSAEFGDFADAIYSKDGRAALLRNRRLEIQPWQTAPWKPLSGLQPTGVEYVPLMLGPDRAIQINWAMRQVQVAPLPQLSPWRELGRVTGDAGFSAWALSRDGRTLALGDFEGRLFLVDTDRMKLRTLPTSRSREITWVAFSEDDVWVAAANRDGTAYTFNVSTGDSLVAGPMNHDFALQRVGISHERRMLIAAGEGRVAVWHLPQQEPRATQAARVGAGPSPHGQAGRYAIDWSFRSGLLASAGLDGQVRLWRLPTAPTLPARAARQLPESFFFDGRHVVDVAWNRLRVVDLDGPETTRWIDLPQPPGFAELVDQGRSLLVTVGPQLRIYDSATLRPRATPLALPASPQSLIPSPDGRRAVLTFGDSDETGFVETLHLYDLTDGRRLPGSATLAAPFRHLEFSPDGRRLLAVGRPVEGATTVLASDGLRVIGEYPHDPYQPVAWASFASNSDLWLVLRAIDPRLGQDALLRWNPDADEVRETRSVGQSGPLEVIQADGRPLVRGFSQDLLDPGGSRVHVLQRLSNDERGQGMSVHGRLVAVIYTHDVQVYDARSGAPLGPPLRADLNAINYVHRTVFSPDGRWLLGRSTQGYWVRWPVGEYIRPVRELSAQLGRLDPQHEDQRTVRMPSAATRRTLRQADPGAWRAAEARPSPPVARWLLGRPIPARSPGTSPLLLDMTSVYNMDPEVLVNWFYNVLPSMRPIPAGVQRIKGVDYDLRGMTQFGFEAQGYPLDYDPARWPRQERLRITRRMEIVGVEVPDVPVAAVRVLMMASMRNKIADERTVAMLRLTYRDGTTASVPIRIQHELPGYSDEDRPVPFAWSIPAAGGAYQSNRDQILSDPRLLNPYPQRHVRSLSVVPLQEAEATAAVALVLAITVEPVAATPTDGVISRPESRSRGKPSPVPSRPASAASAPSRRTP